MSADETVGARRAAFRRRCQSRVGQGQPFLLGAASAGIVAQAAAAAEIDVLLAYNIGAFRMDGHGSMIGYLPYGDANGITLEMARHVLPMAGDVPVIAGVAAADPYRDMGKLVAELVDLGYAGVTNTPTCGVYDGLFRETIEKQGFGFDKEIALVGICSDRDVPTVAYAFTPEQAEDMARAGADILTVHLGLTASGGDEAIERAADRTREIAEAALAVRDDILIAAHGGPLENPEVVGKVTRGHSGNRVSRGLGRRAPAHVRRGQARCRGVPRAAAAGRLGPRHER